MDLVREFESRLSSPGKRACFRKLLGVLGVDDLGVFLDRVGRDELFLADCVRRLVDCLRAEGLSPSTISSFYLPMFKRFLKFCGIRVDWDFVRARVDVPRKRVVRMDRAPTVGELRRMILGARSRRLRLLIWFLAVTGLRVGEALSLKPENFDFSSDPPVVRVVTEKTGHVREVPLTCEIAEELRKWMGENQNHAYVFPNYDYPNKPITFQNIWQDFLDLTIRLGINSRDPSGRGWMIHIHSLRKFFKTRLEEAGVNPLVIEMWMGHDLKVPGAYFRPTRKMILEEWAKAENALTLFKEEEPRYEEIKRIHELEAELAALKRQLTEILNRLQETHNRQLASKHP
ncbi:MAG: tyrosine-type recombinase/integrase [Nitrososphaerota archaeon]